MHILREIVDTMLWASYSAIATRAGGNRPIDTMTSFRLDITPCCIDARRFNGGNAMLMSHARWG